MLNPFSNRVMYCLEGFTGTYLWSIQKRNDCTDAFKGLCEERSCFALIQFTTSQSTIYFGRLWVLFLLSWPVNHAIADMNSGTLLWGNNWGNDFVGSNCFFLISLDLIYGHCSDDTNPACQMRLIRQKIWNPEHVILNANLCLSSDMNQW